MSSVMRKYICDVRSCSSLFCNMNTTVIVETMYQVSSITADPGHWLSGGIV